MLGTGHGDSTSRAVSGDFGDTMGAGVRPACGNSKDLRPDLKNSPDLVRQSGRRPALWHRGAGR